MESALRTSDLQVFNFFREFLEIVLNIEENSV